MSEAQVIYKPNSGSQSDYVACPYYEALYHGTRGPGKTIALLFSFMQQVGKGFGRDYNGIIFRRKYKELGEVRRQIEDFLFNKLYVNSKVQPVYLKSTDEFTFPDGETLKLNYAMAVRDYWNFHGHQYCFLGFDELTSWSSLELYDKLKSICRSTNPKIRTIIRSTTNSLGPGHSVVKEYFEINKTPRGKSIVNELGLKRAHYWGSISENPYILRDKNYIRFLLSIKDPNTIKAWLEGSWDIIAGGALSDLWSPENQILEPFKIPKTWKLYRSMDWGSAKPYCFNVYAISDGSPYVHPKTEEKIKTINKDVFVVMEVYGYGGVANTGSRETPQQAREVVIKKEKDFLSREPYQNRIIGGIADSAIFSKDRGDDNESIADLLKPLEFDPCDKSAGSRILGLEIFREKLSCSRPDKFGNRDSSGIFFFNTLTHALRTLPLLPRDESNPEDADSDSEDHAYDSIRYFLRQRPHKTAIIYPA